MGWELFKGRKEKWIYLLRLCGQEGVCISHAEKGKELSRKRTQVRGGAARHREVRLAPRVHGQGR